MIRYYLAPMVPHPVRPGSYISKVELYRSGDASVSNVLVKVGAGPAEWRALSVLDGPQDQHDACVADAEIVQLPLYNDLGEHLPLTATVAEISAANRATMATRLENWRIPTGWIQGTHRIGRVLAYIIQIAQITHHLREDYPNLGLDLTVQDIPSAQRQRVLQWMTNNGIETGDISLSWVIRQVLQRIVDQYGWPAVLELGGTIALL